MQAILCVMAMRTRLADEFETEAFQCPAHLIPGKVAGKFQATCADNTGS